MARLRRRLDGGSVDLGGGEVHGNGGFGDSGAPTGIEGGHEEALTLANLKEVVVRAKRLGR